MGGAAHVGNATASAEFNVFHDPEAAAITLDAAADLGIPVTMYGLDVFYEPVVGADVVDELIAVGGRGPAELGGRLHRVPERAVRPRRVHDRRRRRRLRRHRPRGADDARRCRCGSSSPARGRAAAPSSTAATGAGTWPTTRTARRRSASRWPSASTGPLRRAVGRHAPRPNGGALMGRVAVLGSLNVDIVTLVERHPVPGETVLGEGRWRFAGGKGGNQARGRGAPGRRVQMLARVGSDEAGRRLRRAPRGPGHRPVGRLDEPHGARPGPPSSPSTSRARTRSSSSRAPTGSPTRPRPRRRLAPATCCSARSRSTSARSADAVRAAHAAGARVVVNLAPYAALPPDVIELADPSSSTSGDARPGRTPPSCRSRCS